MEVLCSPECAEYDQNIDQITAETQEETRKLRMKLKGKIDKGR
jgi:hypothetical protein